MGISPLVGEAVYHTYAHFLLVYLALLNTITNNLCSIDYLKRECTRRGLFICSFEKSGFVHLNKRKRAS